MKHLVIYAHPYEKSFCSSLKNMIIDTSKARNIETVERDLYKIHFSPVLSANEIMGLQKGEVSNDVLKEQQLITDSDLITFVYPIWWTQMPAILKGYIDRVFTHGYAYEAVGHHKFEGLLKFKRVAIFNTIGTTMKESEDQGLIDSMKNLSHSGIIEYVGMDVSLHKFIKPFEIKENEFDLTLKQNRAVFENFLIQS